MKKLPPAIREKHRYLKFRIHSETEFEFGDVVEAVWDATLEYNGSKGVSSINPWIIKNKFDSENQEGVFRVARDEEDNFRAAVAQIDSISGRNAFFEIVKVSGSAKNV